MKLKSIKLQKVKRFTDLTIKGIPETARLIILAGPNGCGKSSLIDGLDFWRIRSSPGHGRWDGNYYIKSDSSAQKTTDNFDSAPYEPVKLDFHDFSFTHPAQNTRKIFYFRSAYRNQSDFKIPLTRDNPITILEQGRAVRMIDFDTRVSENYSRLVHEAFKKSWDEESAGENPVKLGKQYIQDINHAMGDLLPDLKLSSLGNPYKNDGTFRFTKGNSKDFDFMNLSGGEKAVFDLVLDLWMTQRKREYDNTIFCIDEPESHMNAKIHKELLSTLYKMIPPKCQLILATHSIGMMRRARDIEMENPGTVVFLDFGPRNFGEPPINFDKPQIIEPVTPDRKFWKKAYSVAFDDLSELVAPDRVVICEGRPRTEDPSPKPPSDAEIYERIFEQEFPQTQFVPMGGKTEVEGDAGRLVSVLKSIVKRVDVIRLVDGDDKNEDERRECRAQGIHVLSRRNLEAYLFDDEVLRALAHSENQAAKAESLIAKKQQIIAQKNKETLGGDNLKPVRRDIHKACKQILNLTQAGDTTAAFMLAKLAPLIKPNMAVYKQLKDDIFGEN